MAIIDELISRLGFELDGKEDLREFKRGMNDAEKGAKGFATSVTQMARNVTMGIGASIAAVKGLTAGMFAMANSAAGPLDALVKLADRTGESVEAIQEWGFAAEQGGASVQELTNSLEVMGRRLARAARDAGPAKVVLDAYGISALDAAGNIRTATDVMSELADVFPRLSEGERFDLAEALGLSRGMISVLMQGNDEIERLRQTARDAGLIFTDEDARNAEAYNDAMNLLMRSVRALRDRIAIDMLPTLMQMIGGMQDWFMANRQVIQQNIGALMERFARHAQTLNARLRELPDAGWKVYAVLAALTRILFPKLFILGLVAGVVDEFLTYLEGGESIIGAFVDGLQDMLGVSEGVAEVMTGVVAALTALAVIKPAAFLRLVGGIGRLVLAVAGLKALGAAALMTGLASSMGIFAGAALAASWKIALVVAAIWALVSAYKALRSVDFKPPSAEFNEGAPSLQDRGRAEEERLGDDFDDAMKDSLGSRALRFLFGGGGDQSDATVQPQSFGTMGGSDFAPAVGNSVTDNRDQSTTLDIGGVTIQAQTNDPRGMADAFLDQVRLKAATISGERPVSA